MGDVGSYTNRLHHMSLNRNFILLQGLSSNYPITTETNNPIKPHQYNEVS